MKKLIFLVFVSIWVSKASSSIDVIKSSLRSTGKYPNNADKDSLEANYAILRIGYDTVIKTNWQCNYDLEKEDFEMLSAFCVKTLRDIDIGIDAGIITSKTFSKIPNFERIKRFLNSSYEPNCTNFQDDPVFFPFMENYLETLADLTHIANYMDSEYDEHDEL